VPLAWVMSGVSGLPVAPLRSTPWQPAQRWKKISVARANSASVMSGAPGVRTADAFRFSNRRNLIGRDRMLAAIPTGVDVGEDGGDVRIGQMTHRRHDTVEGLAVDLDGTAQAGQHGADDLFDGFAGQVIRLRQWRKRACQTDTSRLMARSTLRQVGRFALLRR
jgi:hypothetical protein